MHPVIPGLPTVGSAKFRMDKGNSEESGGLIAVIPTPYIYDEFSIYLLEMKRDEGILDRAGPFSYHDDP